MKTLSLNISERYYALTILNDFKGNIEKLATILEDIKQFSISEEDWKKANRKIETAGEDKVTWTWNDETAGLKEITVNDSTGVYLADTIKSRSDKGELTVQDRVAIELMNKLK